MHRYLTVEEIKLLYGRPDGTIRRLAHTDHWNRSQDKRRPVLYSATDVEKTMNRLLHQAQLDKPPAPNDADLMFGASALDDTEWPA